MTTALRVGCQSPAWCAFKPARLCGLGDGHMSKNLRKSERVDSTNLLYLCEKDENDTITRQGMGKTLNVSETGIRLQTNFPIDSNKTLMLTIGFEDDLVDVEGKIEYFAENDNQYEFGIRFVDPDDKAKVILSQYVKIFKQFGA